jgi:hypothetical protein
MVNGQLSKSPHHFVLVGVNHVIVLLEQSFLSYFHSKATEVWPHLYIL